MTLGEFRKIVFFLCALALICFVIAAAIIGPQRALKRCLEKGGSVTVGRDMLCFDKEGKFKT